MPTSPDERRRFARFTMERTAWLEAGHQRQPCRLIDISLRGALAEVRNDWRPEPGTRVTLHVALDDEDSCVIEMRGDVAHLASGRIGIHAAEMDLDSSTNLRRLVEMNLGDRDALERELQSMLHDVENA